MLRFFLDKDIDHLKRRLLRSEHVFYTNLYDLESHIYCDGDLRRAIAICLSIDIRRVPHAYCNARDWVEMKAVEWKEWITLCVFSSLYDLDCGCGYGRPSAINPSLLNGTDMIAYQDFKARLESKSGVSEILFCRRFAKVQRIVSRLKAERKLYSILKGKWLESIISGELECTFKGDAVNLQSAGPRLSTAAAAMFDFSSGWAGMHIGRLSALISGVG